MMPSNTPALLYFLKAIPSNRVKVGITTNLSSRLSSYRTHWPDTLELLGTVPCQWEFALALEQSFLLLSRSDHHHGEWVAASPDVLQRVTRYLADYQNWDEVLERQSAPPVWETYLRVIGEIGVRSDLGRDLLLNILSLSDRIRQLESQLREEANRG